MTCLIGMFNFKLAVGPGNVQEDIKQIPFLKLLYINIKTAEISTQGVYGSITYMDF